MANENDTNDYNDTDTLEIDIALKLSQMEGCFKFLWHMNVEREDAPRNETERQSIENNLQRVQEVREMYRTLLRKHKIVSTTSPAVQIANPGCMQPVKTI
jgi:hypothetical protein